MTDEPAGPSFVICHLSSSFGGSPLGRPANIVHQTMPSSSTSASSASGRISSMKRIIACVAALLAGCATVVPLPPEPPRPAPAPAQVLPADEVALGPAIVRGNARWQPVRWTDLPGFGDD